MTITTADVIVQTLIAHGVEVVFGLPGVQTYPLFDALARANLRTVSVRHEQTAAYMAFGYAQATGKTGVYSVVPGPGFLNSSAALISAYGASAPVLCITGEVPSPFIGSGLGHLHELPDQLATMRSLTKWAATVEHPTEAAELTARGLYHARSGRPRPAAIAIPPDVLGAPAPGGPGQPVPIRTPPLEPAAIANAAELLARGKQPMIMVGSGARAASAEIAYLARVLQAPVVSFRGGRGIIPDDDPYGFTSAVGFERWPHTDVLLGIGSRLELSWYRWPDRPAGLSTVLIDIDPRQAVRLQPDVSVVGDAAEAVAALLRELTYTGGNRPPGPPRHTESPRPDRSAEFAELKLRKAAEFRDIGPDLDYLAAIRAVLPADGFFVEEICQVGFASYFGFPVRAPREFVTCGHQGTLGFGFPTALGVKAAFPERPVVSVSGDGGFAFGLADLATAVQYDLGVIAIVFNNEAFGNVLLDQQRLFDGREIGSRLRNPDFAALAKALADGTPAVIEVKTPLGGAAAGGPGQYGTASVWKYLMPAPRAG